MNKDRFFFFGFGQTAKYLVKNLERSKKKFSFSATNTKKTPPGPPKPPPGPPPPGPPPDSLRPRTIIGGLRV